MPGSRESSRRGRRADLESPGGAGRSVEARITGIAAGGAGVGRLPDGRAVFVHRTAPGERALVRVVEAKKRWARAELVRVLEPSPDRREAPCPYYARCGGCTLEHLAYPAQLRAKAALVAEALRRIGGVEVPVPDVTPSPAEFRYRNRVSFGLVRLGHGRVVAGFHELRKPTRVLDIGADCLLPEEPLAAVWGRLRESWGEDASRLPTGARLRLTLRGTSSDEVSLLAEGGFGPGRPDELLQSVPGLVAIWQRTGTDPARPPELLAGEESLAESWQDEVIGLSGSVFLQVNRAAAGLLEQHVVALAGDVAGLRVVDAYCGVGLHTRRLARRGARVTGIELDPHAIAEARRAAPDAAEFLAGRVEDALPEALPADLVIMNPPRGGLHEYVPEQLLASQPTRIIYVSCDPATLARDLARLSPGFRVKGLRCFDLFPQTAHVETVAELERMDVVPPAAAPGLERA